MKKRYGGRTAGQEDLKTDERLSGRRADRRTGGRVDVEPTSFGRCTNNIPTRAIVDRFWPTDFGRRMNAAPAGGKLKRKRFRPLLPIPNTATNTTSSSPSQATMSSLPPPATMTTNHFAGGQTGVQDPAKKLLCAALLRTCDAAGAGYYAKTFSRMDRTPD